MVFRDGILVYNNPGALPAEALDEIISAVQGLNMDEVRAEVAKALEESKNQNPS
jgi:thioredoxin 1